MTDKKQADNEKLIQELYEKLWWYTYEADEEEYNDREVDAIVQLLEVLEPIGDDPELEPGADAAFERFKARYDLEAAPEDTEDAENAETAADGKKSLPEMKAETGKTNEAGAGDAVEKKAETGGKTGPEKHIETEDGGKAEKKAVRRPGRRKRLFRLGGAAVASVVLVLSLNVGTYALREKSFFEVVMDSVGAREVIVTGNESGLEQIEESNTADIECSSWEEVEEIVGEKVLQVDFLPEGYELNEIRIKILHDNKHIIAKYNNNGKYFTIAIYIYSSNYVRSKIEHDKEWELIKEDTTGKGAQYYMKEDKIEASFLSGKGVYYVLSNEELEMVEKVVNGMK